MKRLFDLFEITLGIVLLAVITVLVFIAAVMRFFDHPLIWSVDLAQLMFIWLCFIGAARAMRRRLHLGVDFVARLLPHHLRLALETALYCLFTAFLLTLAVEGYKLTMMNLARKFGDSGLSYAWVTIAVPVGSVLLILAMTENLVEAWRKRASDGPLVYTTPRSPAAPAPVIEEL